MPKLLLWNDIVEKGEAFHLARITIKKEIPSGWHSHDFTELLFVESGKGWHKLNGTSLQLKPGDFFVIRPSDIHEITTNGNEKLTLINLAFSAEFLKDFTGRFEEIKVFYDFSSNEPFFTNLDASNLQHLVEETLELSSCPRTIFHLERFLLNVFYLLKPQTPFFSQIVPEWLLKAINEIQKPENFRKGVNGLVEASNRSHEHVSREVKKHLGQTPTEYVNKIRIEYAAKLLRMSGLPIFEIAEESGFNNLNHFYKLFASYFNESPRHYRLNHQKKIIRGK